MKQPGLSSVPRFQVVTARTIGWTIGTGSLALVLGFSISRTALMGGLFLLAAAVVIIRLRPELTIIGVFAMTALPGSLYLQARLNVEGILISLQDAESLLLIGAAMELRSRGKHGSRFQTARLRVVIGLLAGGLLLGSVAGLTAGADTYQWLRVVRLDVVLIGGLFAVLLAGHLPSWRRAVRTGLIVAGVLVIGQIIISVAYALSFGSSLWVSLGLPGAVDIHGQIREGNVNILRENSLSAFLILPLFALAVARSNYRDHYVIMGALAASMLSLSRGLWAAMIGVGILAMAWRLRARGRGRLVVLTVWFIAATGVSAVVIQLTGNVVATRIAETTRLTDRSSDYRFRETEIALEELTRDPLTMVAGTGAGVIIQELPSNAGVASARDRSSFLENTLLSLWANGSIFLLIGACILLLSAGALSWRSQGVAGCERDLLLMGLCLPIVLIAGAVSGVGYSLGTLPFWVLAGTLLIPVSAGDRTPLSLRQGSLASARETNSSMFNTSSRGRPLLSAPAQCRCSSDSAFFRPRRAL